MPKLNVDAKLCVAAAFGLFFGLSSAQAQTSTQNVDYLSYEGAGIVLGDTGTVTANSPGTISATCTAGGLSVGDTRLVTFRFNLGQSTPNPTFDAIGFVRQSSVYRLVAVSPTTNLSLNTAPGAATVNWNAINGRAGGPSLAGSSTTLTIDAGTGGAISTSFP